MYTEEELIALEEQEFEQTKEQFAIILMLFVFLHETLEKEITQFYQKYGKDGIVTYQEARKWISDKDHRKRLFVLLATVNKSFTELYNNLESGFKSHLKELIKMEEDFFNHEVSDVEKLLLIKWGIDSLSWLDRLSNNCYKWLAVISNDFKKAMLQKKSISEILSNLDKRFKSMEKAMWKLFMTESSAINSIVRKELFKYIGVKKYQYYARVDERTCDTCGELHGKIFPMTAYEVGVTASPIHSHCRCWEIPIIN